MKQLLKIKKVTEHLPYADAFLLPFSGVGVKEQTENIGYG